MLKIWTGFSPDPKRLLYEGRYFNSHIAHSMGVHQKDRFLPLIKIRALRELIGWIDYKRGPVDGWGLSWERGRPEAVRRGL